MTPFRLFNRYESILNAISDRLICELSDLVKEISKIDEKGFREKCLLISIQEAPTIQQLLLSCDSSNDYEFKKDLYLATNSMKNFMHGRPCHIQLRRTLDYSLKWYHWLESKNEVKNKIASPNKANSADAKSRAAD